MFVACGSDSDPGTSAGGGAGITGTGGWAPGGSGGTSASGGSASGGAAGNAGAAGLGGSGGALPAGPTRYPSDAVTSPVTEHVAERLRAIAGANATREPHVFMKVGDSHTVSTNLLYCFAGAAQPKYQLALDGREALLPSIDHFRQGSIAGSTPFDRPSSAAMVGKTASWAISGNPAPVEQEITASNARFAFVSYGSNDMQMGVTFATAAYPFYSNLSQLLDQLEQAGIVPIVAGLPPRGDPSAALWATTYDSITRGIAEARQLPYLSMYVGTKGLPNQGLVSDGLHGNVYVTGGSAQPCVFTPTALKYNYNFRNLESIQQLDVVKRVVLDSAAAPDAPIVGPTGDGKVASPIVIDALPFTHAADTKSGGETLIDQYSGCASSANESGPEHYYQLEITQTTPIRAMLFDRSGVDVDLHLLSGGTNGAACVERHDRLIERTLAPGTYTLVVDSFVSSGNVLAGDYLLVVVRCDSGDTSCQ